MAHERKSRLRTVSSGRLNARSPRPQQSMAGRPYTFSSKGSAPRESSRLIVAACELNAASCSAVLPKVAFALTGTPHFSTSASTIFSCPWSAAACSGFLPVPISQTSAARHT
eukprot:Amastigsp_a680215_59.p2 type:complete len:112 gc:universal Amastigsp_a680215_59:566-231(-)